MMADGRPALWKRVLEILEAFARKGKRVREKRVRGKREE
jgi:hypothetical protein